MAADRSGSSDYEVAWFSHKHGDTATSVGRENRPRDHDSGQQGRWPALRNLRRLCRPLLPPAGDARLTRLATNLTRRFVVVVQWSRARKRHERQGILIDEPAYHAVLAEVEAGRTAFRVVEPGDGDKVLGKE